MLLITVINKVQGVHTNNVSNFFRKVFNCPNVVASYIPTTVFKRVAVELLQYLYVSSCKQRDLLIRCATKDCFYKVVAGQSRHTFSRSYFWVNFWNLGLLMFSYYYYTSNKYILLLKCWMFHHQVWLDFSILLVHQEILASHRLSSKK